MLTTIRRCQEARAWYWKANRIRKQSFETTPVSQPADPAAADWRHHGCDQRRCDWPSLRAPKVPAAPRVRKVLVGDLPVFSASLKQRVPLPPPPLLLVLPLKLTNTNRNLLL